MSEIRETVLIVRKLGREKANQPYKWEIEKENPDDRPNILGWWSSETMPSFKTGKKYNIEIKEKNSFGWTMITNENHYALTPNGEILDGESIIIANSNGDSKDTSKVSKKKTQVMLTPANEIVANGVLSNAARPPKQAIQVMNQTEQIMASEKRDDDLIVAELQGQVIKEYFYSFQTGGKNVVGISAAGIKAIKNQMGGIHIVTPEKEIVWKEQHPISGEWVWYSTVKVVDTKTGNEGLGVSEHELKDKFGRHKAVAKAKRNAFRDLFDEALIIKMGEKWLSRR